MKHNRAHDILHDSSGLSLSYRHMSYALFRTDASFGQVIAARFPVCALLREGDILQCSLGLSDEAVSYLMSCEQALPPLFVLSRAGLGLLSKRYDMAAGAGLYLHIHCDPGAGARLLCAHALGKPDGGTFCLSRRVMERAEPLHSKDATAFPALADAYQAICVGLGGLLPTGPRGSLAVSDLRYALITMADFVGCDLRFEGFPETIGRMGHDCSDIPALGCLMAGRAEDRHWEAPPLPCYRPLVAEAMLLYILTEMRTHAHTRGGTVSLVRNGAISSLTFHYPLEVASLPMRVRVQLAEMRAYLSECADYSGLSLSFPSMPSPKHPSCRGSAISDRQSITMEWLRDPTLLPSRDLKADTELKLTGR